MKTYCKHKDIVKNGLVHSDSTADVQRYIENPAIDAGSTQVSQSLATDEFKDIASPNTTNSSSSSEISKSAQIFTLPTPMSFNANELTKIDRLFSYVNSSLELRKYLRNKENEDGQDFTQIVDFALPMPNLNNKSLTSLDDVYVHYCNSIERTPVITGSDYYKQFFTTIFTQLLIQCVNLRQFKNLNC